MKKTLSSTHPMLLEMLLAMLFFALSAAVIVQLIAGAYTVSRKSARQSLAILALQDQCEAAKAALLSGEGPAGTETLWYDGDFEPAGQDGAAYRVDLTVTPEKTGAGTYYGLDLTAATAAGETLTTLRGGVYVPEVEP